MKKINFKRRIVWSLVLVVSFFSIFQASISYFILESLEDEITDALVMSQMSTTLQELSTIKLSENFTSEDKIMDGFYVWVGNHPNRPSRIKNLENGLHILHENGMTYHVAVASFKNLKVSVMFDASFNENRIEYAAMAIASSALLSIIIVSLLARRISQNMTQTLDSVANYIRTWQRSNLSNPQKKISNETDVILSAFDDIQKRMTYILADESRFSTKLNHELRSLLTLIRTDAEIALLPNLTENQKQQKLTGILNHVDMIEASLRVLSTRFFEQHQHKETFSIAEVLKYLVPVINNERLNIVIDFSPRIHMHSDKYAFLVISRNLIQNVIDHAQANLLRIYMPDSLTLVFEDDGHGIAEDVLKGINNHSGIFVHQDYDSLANQSGPIKNYGLGLSIVSQIVRKLEATLIIESQQKSNDTSVSFTKAIIKFNENSIIFQ